MANSVIVFSIVLVYVALRDYCDSLMRMRKAVFSCMKPRGSLLSSHMSHQVAQQYKRKLKITYKRTRSTGT